MSPEVQRMPRRNMSCVAYRDGNIYESAIPSRIFFRKVTSLCSWKLLTSLEIYLADLEVCNYVNTHLLKWCFPGSSSSLVILSSYYIPVLWSAYTRWLYYQCHIVYMLVWSYYDEILRHMYLIVLMLAHNATLLLIQHSAVVWSTYIGKLFTTLPTNIICSNILW